MTPNTGYWMPDYAYYDYLEERGWSVEELRECEEWCYPYGYRVVWQIMREIGQSRHPSCGVLGVNFNAERNYGGIAMFGDVDLVHRFKGDGEGWLFYD